MTRTIPALFALLLVGCGAPFNNRWFEEDALFTSAVPDADELRSDTPAPDASTRDVGDPSRAVAFTDATARSVNGLNLWLLSVLDAVVQEPITARDEHVRSWGPYPLLSSDERSVQLRIERVGEGQFLYLLEGQSDPPDAVRDNAWLVLLEGRFDRVGDLRDGAGSFTYDASALAALTGEAVGGTMSSEYATDEGSVELYSEFRDWEDPDRDSREWDYYFERHRGVGGLFEFRTPAQVVGEADSALETWRLRSRWSADRSGRADAFVVGGDVPARIPSVECWDEAGLRTYFRVGARDAPLEEEGVVGDCLLEEDLPRDLRD